MTIKVILWDPAKGRAATSSSSASRVQKYLYMVVEWLSIFLAQICGGGWRDGTAAVQIHRQKYAAISLLYILNFFKKFFLNVVP
jgi:hypothetical protein